MTRNIEYTCESIIADFSADELPASASDLDWYYYAERFDNITTWINSNVSRSAMIEALATTGGWDRMDLLHAEDNGTIARNITALLLASAYDTMLDYMSQGHDADRFDGIVECY